MRSLQKDRRVLMIRGLFPTLIPIHSHQNTFGRLRASRPGDFLDRCMLTGKGVLGQKEGIKFMLPFTYLMRERLVQIFLCCLGMYIFISAILVVYEFQLAVDSDPDAASHLAKLDRLARDILADSAAQGATPRQLNRARHQPVTALSTGRARAYRRRRSDSLVFEIVGRGCDHESSLPGQPDAACPVKSLDQLYSQVLVRYACFLVC